MNRIIQLIHRQIPFIIGASDHHGSPDLWVAFMHRDRHAAECSYSYREGSKCFFTPNDEERFYLRALISDRSIKSVYDGQEGALFEYTPLPFKDHYKKRKKRQAA